MPCTGGNELPIYSMTKVEYQLMLQVNTSNWKHITCFHQYFYLNSKTVNRYQSVFVMHVRTQERFFLSTFTTTRGLAIGGFPLCSSLKAKIRSIIAHTNEPHTLRSYMNTPQCSFGAVPTCNWHCSSPAEDHQLEHLPRTAWGWRLNVAHIFLKCFHHL